MVDFLNFISNQTSEFWSKLIIIFMITALIGFFICLKFLLNVKNSLILSLVIGLFVIISAYSIGYNCYGDIRVQREKELLIDIDKGIDKVVLDFLKINYKGE